MTHLTAAQRVDLAAVPLPAEPPSDTAVVPVPGGWSAAWVIDSGLRKQAIGPVCADPLVASEASSFLREIHGLRS